MKKLGWIRKEKNLIVDFLIDLNYKIIKQNKKLLIGKFVK